MTLKQRRRRKTRKYKQSVIDGLLQRKSYKIRRFVP